MPKGTRSAARGSRGGVVEVIHTPKHTTLGVLTGLVVRSRAELLVLTALIVSMTSLNSLVGWTWMWIILGVAVAAGAAWPWSRRFVTARLWCVLDRHRIRSALREARVRTMTRDGSLPYLVWARPNQTGERVRVLLRAGCSAEDVQGTLDYIAPACLARDARMERKKKQSAVIYIDIIRRDPLENQVNHTSPLIRWFGKADETDAATDVTPISSARSTKTETEPTTSPAPKSSTAVVNGEDLSDYVD